jgi:phage-related protein
MKALIWVGSCLEDLRSFPEDVRRTIGYALYLAQSGQKHPDAKPLRGFGGAGVLEVVEDFEGNAYRAVYTVSLPDAVYVLHAFQKKAKRGIATPKRDIEIIRARLLRAHDHNRQHRGGRT